MHGVTNPQGTRLGPTVNGVNQEATGCLERIKKIFDSIIETLRSLVHFPLRYLGSKDGSIIGVLVGHQDTPGYHRYTEKTLTAAETKEYVDHAAIAGLAFSNNLELVAPLEYQVIPLKALYIDDADLEQQGDRIIDRQTGLRMALVEKDRHVYFAIAGVDDRHVKFLEASQERTKFFNALTCALGQKHAIYRRAEEIFLKIRDRSTIQGRPFTLIGQSLGGMCAQYIGIRNQQPTICLNGFPMGAGVQEEISDERLAHADRYCTHIIVEDDPYADNSILGYFDIVLSRLGIRTPANFGHRYTLPSAYNNGTQTHAFVLGSMMHHLGLHQRTTISEYVQGVRHVSSD